jgi:hypothetical protein
MTLVHDYVVPAGKRWVVRDIDAYVSTLSSPAIFFFETDDDIGGFPTFYAGKVDAASQDSVQWRGRQVLLAGQTLRVNPNGNTIDVRISGYELDDP